MVQFLILKGSFKTRLQVIKGGGSDRLWQRDAVAKALVIKCKRPARQLRPTCITQAKGREEKATGESEFYKINFF
jgi:hypothetical protein